MIYIVAEDRLLSSALGSLGDGTMRCYLTSVLCLLTVRGIFFGISQSHKPGGIREDAAGDASEDLG